MVTSRVLDITRTISRVGRGHPTGIDRVELAYLRHLLTVPDPLFLFAKVVAGYVLLDRTGAQEIARKLNEGISWGKLDIVGLLSRRAHPTKRRAEADLRRLAIGHCRRGGLNAILSKHIRANASYINVGHSNITQEVYSAFGRVENVRLSTMIHDTIPIDFPEFQRRGTPEQFETKLRCALEHSDLIICNSNQTSADIVRWSKEWGLENPSKCVAHLGVELPETDLGADIEVIPAERPTFLCLGTIEPRKNHKLLLDIWDDFVKELPDEEIPALVIAGSRGWNNEDVFARLDSSPMIGRHIFERSDLNDSSISALLKGCAGLLLPSHAEGFGLPPAEAALTGAPILCNTLPVIEEILGNIPVYVSNSDVYSWKKTITKLANEKRAGIIGAPRDNVTARIPTWKDHFNQVLKVV